MDVNQIKLQGVITEIYPKFLAMRSNIFIKFQLRTLSSERSFYDYHEIYLNKSKDKELLCFYKKIIKVGNLIRLQGELRSYLYTDSLGKTIRTSRINAYLIEKV